MVFSGVPCGIEFHAEQPEQIDEFVAAVLQLELVTLRPVPGVHAETPAGRITFGFRPDLNVAMGDAPKASINLRLTR